MIGFHGEGKRVIGFHGEGKRVIGFHGEGKRVIGFHENYWSDKYLKFVNFFDVAVFIIRFQCLKRFSWIMDMKERSRTSSMAGLTQIIWGHLWISNLLSKKCKISKLKTLFDNSFYSTPFFICITTISILRLNFLKN